MDLAEFYPALARAGLAYGPCFQGVRAAWRRDEEIFAEVALPAGLTAAGFGLHPALLDAALQVSTLMAGHDGAAGLLLPFAWSDVAVHAPGAVTARVRVAPAGPGVSVLLTDTAGAPVASAGSVALRALPDGELGAAGTSVAREALFRVEWVPADPSEAAIPAAPGPAAAGPGRCAVLGPDAGLGVPGAVRYRDLAALAAAAAAGEPVPDTVVTCCLADGPAQAAGLAARTLRLVQEWLADPRFAASRLVIVTRRAVDAGPGTPADPGEPQSGGWYGPRRPSTRAGSSWPIPTNQPGRGPWSWPGPRSGSGSSRCAASSCGCRGWRGPSTVSRSRTDPAGG